MSVSLGIEVPAGVQATIVLNNFNATSIPLVTDDSSQGYSRGSLWLWATPTFNSFFVCYDATVGAAVWRRIAIQALHNIFSVEDGSGVHVSGPIVIYGSSPFNYLEFTIAGLTRRVQNVGGLLKTIDVPGVEGRYISNDSLEVVDVPAGGTGVATLADGGVLVGNGTGVVQVTAVGTAGHVLTSNGAGSDPTFQAASSLPVVDTTAIVTGSADATKKLRFEVDGFTTGTTRVLTPPNFDGTIATLAGTETLSGKTLTTPTISATGFTNAQHAHTAASSGGTLSTNAIASGILPQVRGGTGVASYDFCHATHSAAQAVATATWTALALNTDRQDPNGLHPTGAGNTKITFATDGQYTVGGNIEFAANAVGIRGIAIRMDGATYIAKDERAATATGTVSLHVSTSYYFTAGQYVELMAYQSSGGNLNANQAAEYSPELWVQFGGI